MVKGIAETAFASPVLDSLRKTDAAGSGGSASALVICEAGRMADREQKRPDPGLLRMRNNSSGIVTTQ